MIVERAPTATPLSQLHPSPWNPRLLRDSRFKQLCRSMQADPDFLWQRPVLASADGTIYAGNMRYRAAQHLGWPDIPAIVSDVPDQLAKERALRDNNQFGEWQEQELAELLAELGQAGADLDLLGFPDGDVERLLDSVGALGETATDPGAQLNRAEELRQKWGTERGQLWEIGRHRLLCGDSSRPEDAARLMGDDLAAALITDPPYSSGGATRGDRTAPTNTKYVQTGTLRERPDFAGDNRDQRAWTWWCERWLALYLVHVKDGACCAIWTDWRQLPALSDALQGGGWVWRGIVVWDKTESARPAWGRFRAQCEYVLWGSAGPLAINDGRPTYRGCWSQSVKSEEKEHITQKPAAVVAWTLSMVQPEGIVVDPFLGSGTTIVAAEQTGRVCYGMEIEPNYVAVALERLAGMGLDPRLTDG